MAAVAKAARGVSLCTPIPPYSNQITGLLATEDIVAGDACRVTSTGIALSVNAEVVDGFALTTAKAGEPVTLAHDVNLRYGDNLTGGVFLYLSTTVDGGLDTTVNGDPVARTYDNQRVHVVKKWS